jgi:hypothetical protein
METPLVVAGTPGQVADSKTGKTSFFLKKYLHKYWAEKREP